MRKLAACALLLIAAACKDDTEKEVPVPAKACFNFPEELIHGEEGTFDASCSSADTLTWQFGDGTTSNDRITKHSFLAPGKYYVNLTIYKDGTRDDKYGYINIRSTEKEQACIPSYAAGLSMWPAPSGSDSVVFLYDEDKRVNEIQWYESNASVYAGRARIGYNSDGKMGVVDFFNYDGFSLVATINYNIKGLPSTIKYSDLDQPDLYAEFTHDLTDRLTAIRYSSQVNAATLEQTTTYGYDAYGNAINIGYNDGPEGGDQGLVRENTAFYNTLTFYSASRELKFFFDYVLGVEPYVNSMKWSTVKANRGGPGWWNYHSYTDHDMNNPPGLDREYAIEVDPNTNLPVSLKPNTGDIIGTDLTYTKVVYICDPN